MKRRSKTQIQNLIAEWRQSGFSQSKFCRSKSLSLSTFQTWLKKENKGSASITPAFSFVEVLDDTQVSYPQSRTLVLKTSYGLILEIPL